MNTCATKDNKDAFQLLTDYQNGDNSAFTFIYNMYIQKMLSFGSCLTSDRELVKDCIQDVFLRLLDRNHMPDVHNLGSYLIISLRNRLLDEFRRNNFTSDVEVDSFTMRLSNEDLERSFIDRETDFREHVKVVSLMQSLTPRQRQAFQLYYLEEKKYEEICHIMKLNHHSVRNLIHRGMLKLRAAAV